jgi:hypothetical protein
VDRRDRRSDDTTEQRCFFRKEREREEGESEQERERRLNWRECRVGPQWVGGSSSGEQECGKGKGRERKKEIKMMKPPTVKEGRERKQGQTVE